MLKVVEMTVPKLLMFAAVFLAIYWVLLPVIGFKASTLVSILFTLGIVLVLDYFKILPVFPIPLQKRVKLFLMIGLIGFSLWSAGYFASLKGLFPGTVVTTPPTEKTELKGCVVSEELKGKTATVYVNAWDLESDQPYSSAVDLTTNCWVYRNGNKPINYVGTTTDTSSGTISGFSVGDTIYIYCGGSSYYVEPVEEFCIDTQTPTVNLNAHKMVSESDLQITAYDDTGSATLSSATYADYYITMGAGEKKAIYLKLKVNTANKAFNFGGWAIAKFYNISDVEPQDVEATYEKIGTPNFAEGVNVKVNESAGTTITKDYTIWKASSPILLREWDSIKEQFVIESDSTNDPVGNEGTTNFNGVAIVALDMQYARGADGKVYLDVYQHDSGEANVGLAEDLTSPYGKTSGVLIEVR